MGVDGQRHAPAALPPGKRPGILYTGGWVGLKAGIGTKVLKKNLKAIPEKPSKDELHTAAKLGTSYIIRTVLQSESGSLSGGDRRCFKKRSTGKKRPVTRDK